MNRLPIFILISAAFAHAAPLHASPEYPVAPIVWTAAPGEQTAPVVASSDSMAFAVWTDHLNGVYRRVGSRIDLDGKVLDVAGIDFNGAWVSGIAWNGSAFIAIADKPEEPVSKLIFVSPAGQIEKTAALPAKLSFFAATEGGADVHILLQEQGGASATMVDGQGSIVASGIPLRPALTEPAYGAYGFIAAASASEFLVLYQQRNPAVFTATRIDKSGRVISVVNPALPLEISTTDALAAGPGGFLYVAFRNDGLRAYPLDETGTLSGSPIMIDPQRAQLRSITRPAIVGERDRYIVAWNVSLLTGAAYTYVTDITGNRVGSLRQTNALGGITYNVAFASFREHRVLLSSAFYLYTASSTDVFSQRLSASLEADAPRVVAPTATLQTKPRVAATRSGYGVAWAENGPDAFVHHYFRRFSDNGVPIDSAPIELGRKTPQYGFQYFWPTPIVSNGTTYLVGWGGNSDGFNFLRFPVDGGASIDEAPISIPAAQLEIASNGSDAVAVYRGTTGLLFTQRVRLLGPPVADARIEIAKRGEAFQIASNGKDYLVTWEDRYTSSIICDLCFSLYDLLAMRVAADGSRIDALPLQLQKRGIGRNLALASNGARYLALWVGWSAESDIAAALVSNEGAMVETGTVMRGSNPLSASATNIGEDFFVVAGFVTLDPRTTLQPTRYSAVRFHSLSGTGRQLPTPLVTEDQRNSRSIALSSDGTNVVIGYDRNATAAEGGSPRVFVRVFSTSARRRATAH